MGAREELLAAARALTKRGSVPFSPKELIAEARQHGCGYPDTTLRTFINGPMCVNSPDHHAVQYADLVRIAHGLYRLAADSAGPVTQRPRPAAVQHSDSVTPTYDGSTALAQDEWYWEGNVQAAIVRHLAAAGWHIRRVAETATREHGVDVEADRAGQRLLVEVKGYPSAVYARGERQGQSKSTPAPLQARMYYSNAVLTGLILRAEHPDAQVVLAFPDFQTYGTLARRTIKPLSSAGIDVWTVDVSGTVVDIGNST